MVHRLYPDEGFWRAAGSVCYSDRFKIDMPDACEIRTDMVTRCFRLKNRALIQEDLMTVSPP